MPMTEAQVQLARKIIDFIEANPARHDQGSWLSFADDEALLDKAKRDDGTYEPCGTTGCFAGWVVLDHYIAEAQVVLDPGYVSADVPAAPGDPAMLLLPDGKRLGDGMIRREAIRLLGINERTAESMFDGSNTVEQLRQMVDLLPDEDAVVELSEELEAQRDEIICDCGCEE